LAAEALKQYPSRHYADADDRPEDNFIANCKVAKHELDCLISHQDGECGDAQGAHVERASVWAGARVCS
jgi:hypothetical protein